MSRITVTTSFVVALAISFVCSAAREAQSQPLALKPSGYAHYFDQFNEIDSEPVENAIPNAKAWEWLIANAPLFDCPDEDIKRTYYFRWWTYRKHIRETPYGLVLTEFLTPVGHAGSHNTISCAFGHHVVEGRWLRDQKVLDDYILFWFRSGSNETAAPHFHKFSGWAAAAIYDRYLVTLDRDFVVDLLDDLVSDFERWEQERRRPDGLFWQFDVADGMEESISGGRRVQNVRPTINSYMAANALAIARIAELAGRPELAARFQQEYESLKTKLNDSLWDENANFYKVQFESGKLSDAREAIGFIPWMFNLAPPEHAVAWEQLADPQGFSAPRGLTTAERRHPAFRTHGTGTCEWDGAVWPFATSQTLGGLANLLRGPAQEFVTRDDYFNALQTYARSHQKDGQPYIGEYHDEKTGAWLITGPKEKRSRHYNHSTFCDLIITDLVGLVPRADSEVVVHPLLPDDKWDWFCLDDIPYHGHALTIIWDRTGDRYGKGAGLSLWSDGNLLATTETLSPLHAHLPDQAAD